METLICPTCGCSLVRLGISKDQATPYSHEGKEYFFCCQGCVDVFAADPEKRLEETKDLIVCPTCLAEKCDPGKNAGHRTKPHQERPFSPAAWQGRGDLKSENGLGEVIERKGARGIGDDLENARTWCSSSNSC